MELGSSAVQIGSAGARTALHYAETFSTSADDFADRAPGIISNTGFQAGHSVIKVARFFAHPVKALASIGRTALICGAIVLLLLIIGLLGQMGGATTTSVLCADRPEDIQQLRLFQLCAVLLLGARLAVLSRQYSRLWPHR